MTTMYQPTVAPAEAYWRERPKLTPLKTAAAAKGLGFGMAVSFGRFSAQSRMRELVLRECSLLTNTGNQLIAPIHPQENTYDFVASDWVVDWATANGISSVQGGHLLYHQSMPSWLTAITGVAASRTACESHIQNVMEHLAPRGQTHWNVVNEVVNGDDAATGFRNNYFFQVHGTAYPTWAFQKARAVRPTDTLLWTTNHIEDNTAQGGDVVRSKTLAAIDQALAAGADIDGFGTQMHLQLGNGANAATTPSVVTDFLNQVASRGLDIYITELDVGDSVFPYATRQTDIYNLVVNYVGSVCRDVPRLKHITCWGVMDTDSWIITEQPRADGYGVKPLPFDGQGYPNRMAHALLDSFALRPAA